MLYMTVFSFLLIIIDKRCVVGCFLVEPVQGFKVDDWVHYGS